MCSWLVRILLVRFSLVLFFVSFACIGNSYIFMHFFHLLKKSIRNPKKAALVIFYKIMAPFGANNHGKFIVLARARTGSNLLISLLNSHPNIYVESEIFAMKPREGIDGRLRKVFSKQPGFIMAKGFKVFYFHPNDCPNCALMHELQKNSRFEGCSLKEKKPSQNNNFS